MTTFDLETWLEQRRAAVDDALARALELPNADDPERLREAMRYAVLQGGKRMRPMLVVAACEAAGGAVEQALPACCALEMIHAYSLVHDDLPAMDDDAERRGQPTVHVKYGEANAILVGDALLTEAFRVLGRGTEGVGRAAVAEAVLRLAHHAGIDGMVGGQALDLAAGQDLSDLEALERVHALKTGALYAAAGALGGLSAGADRETVDALERFGLAFGVAFQHADDVLDDDQPRLRAQAMARTEALLETCRVEAGRFGAQSEALRGVTDWLADRVARASAGARFE